MTRGLRALQKDTLTELARNLEFVLPYESHIHLSQKEVSESFVKRKSNPENATRISYDPKERNLTFFLFHPKAQIPVAGLSIKLKREPDVADLKFCKDYLRVFGADVGKAPNIPSNNELWITLQQTRFARAIGRFSPFATEHFMRWLRVIENASSLRYEGRQYSACILMTKQLRWVEKSRSANFVKFPISMAFEDAILKEKWTRAILRDPLIGLVGLSLAGSIIGAVTFKAVSEPGSAFAPHEEMIPISSAIVPGTMAFVTSSHGDLYVLFPSGATFVKAQGRWRYFNYSSLTELVTRLVPYEITPGLVRIVLDLSFERRGGLIAIVKNESTITKIVPDHSTNGRVNQSLRITYRIFRTFGIDGFF